MKVSEMFELVKQGYKPSEIKEMAELMKDAEPEEAKEKEPETEPKEEPAPDTLEEPKEEPKPEPKEEPEIDYKKLYEEKCEQLAAAQRQNVKKDMSGGEPDNNDILTQAIRGFM